MSKFFTYTLLCVVAVDLLATAGDITQTWTSPVFIKLKSNSSSENPLGTPISDSEESLIGSLLNIGAMIGPFPFSYLSERFGRKVALLSIAIPHAISYLTLAFGKSVYLYYFARIVGGMAVGGGYVLLPMYVAEVAEDYNRGQLSVSLNIFWTFGNLMPYVLGPYLTMQWFNIILAFVPVLFFVVFLLVAPETPYYLVSRKDLNAAENSLMMLRSVDRLKASEEVHKIQKVLENNEEGSFWELFHKGNLKALFISLVLISSQQLSGIPCVLFYTQEIFEAAGANSIPEDISSIIVGLALFASSFITPFMADSWGRKPLMLISEMGMVIAHCGFGVYFLLKDQEYDGLDKLSWLPISSFIFYIFTFNLAMGPVPWTISSELFPSNVKSVAASLVSATCWATSFVITELFTMMLNLPNGGTFWLFAGFCLFSFVFTLIFVPETKGRSFKEIQEIMKR